MSQRTQTILIVTGVLLLVLVVGVVTGQLEGLSDSVGTIWDALF